MTVTTLALMELTVAALKAANTAAGQRVYGPRDWPTWNGKYPALLVTFAREDKESLGRNGAPSFTVTGTIRVTGRVAALAKPDDAAAAIALHAAGVLARQVEVAVINADTIMVDRTDPALPRQRLQQFPFVRTEIASRATGKGHLVEAAIDIGMEFYQGADDFAPTTTVPLDTVAIYTDLTDVFDPTGTYADPPFPGSVVPAPRSSGPDGRTEGGVLIDNLQS